MQLRIGEGMKRTDGYYLNMVVKDQPEIWFTGYRKSIDGLIDRFIPGKELDLDFDVYVINGEEYTTEKIDGEKVYSNLEGEYVASRYYEDKLVPFGEEEDEDHDYYHIKTFESFGSWIDDHYQMLDHMYQSCTAEGYIPKHNNVVAFFNSSLKLFTFRSGSIHNYLIFFVIFF